MSTKDQVFDIGLPPPEPEVIPVEVQPEREDLKTRALRRAQEEEMRSKLEDMSGWRVRWTDDGQVEFSQDDGATWQVFHI